jgi:hypothetical protein
MAMMRILLPALLGPEAGPPAPAARATRAGLAVPLARTATTQGRPSGRRFLVPIPAPWPRSPS